MLQYRTSPNWITTNSGKNGLTIFDACRIISNDICTAIFQETSFSLNDNATHLQLAKLDSYSRKSCLVS